MVNRLRGHSECLLGAFLHPCRTTISTLAPPRNLYSPRRLRRTTRRRDFVPWRFPAARRQSAYVAPLAEKLRKAQTQRFRAVSSASALYPEQPSVSRPSGRAGPAPRC